LKGKKWLCPSKGKSGTLSPGKTGGGGGDVFCGRGENEFQELSLRPGDGLGCRKAVAWRSLRCEVTVTFYQEKILRKDIQLTAPKKRIGANWGEFLGVKQPHLLVEGSLSSRSLESQEKSLRTGGMELG